MKNKFIYWCFLWCFLLTICQTIVADVEESIYLNNNRTDSNDLAIDRSITDLVDYIFNFNSQTEGRTFGIKRIQFMMMPMIFKMGVMMTLLIVLTVISLKGLTIGVILLILKLSTIFAKVYSALNKSQNQIPWTPPVQPVNVHFHNDGYHHHPFSGYDGPSSMENHDHHFYHRGSQRIHSEPPYFI
ncbi:uncharacterized protein [Chelonus insularis]|uniref:uncharacterized protein n=1 Tax=Chelonus insularis TaxID=460826 RepID=UPI00158B2D95|nr:uncharacterized protein LOC118074464 [Chelonus insularis]